MIIAICWIKVILMLYNEPPYIYARNNSYVQIKKPNAILVYEIFTFKNGF